MTVRTRFAPSPTGFLHVGSVRTALFAYLYAKKHDGQFILRIEDTDKKREVEGSIGHLMESLKWLRINWDEGIDIGGPHEPYIQSARLETYKKYAEKLIQTGFAYPDPYTDEEVEAFRAKAIEEGSPFLYRDHRPETILEWDGTRALRFKTPFIKRYTWQDAVRGELSAGEEALDDFILIKADGYPTYNFAHIVDDIEMKITHVMRGEEFISSTPKFLSLYDALELPPPIFATLPVILADTGTKKLGKRDGAKDILDYRADGFLPEALINFLALQGWNPGTEQEVFSMNELIEQFDLSHVQKSGAMFNEEKLLALNQWWMRTLAPEEYLARGNFEAADTASMLKTVPSLKERAHTFKEAREMLFGELSCLFARPTLLPESLRAKELPSVPSSTREHLETFSDLLSSLPQETTPETLRAALMPYADSIPKEAGGRGSALWPLRYALSGQEKSPDPFTLIYILGTKESMSRIATALAILSP